jgi:glycosyltransferase involved in cell wall biosynthesis
MSLNEASASIVYMHSERVYYDKSNNLLHLTSGNLIDFFLVVFDVVGNSVLITPKTSKKGEVIYRLGANTRVYDVSFPEVGDKKRRQVRSVFSFLKDLTSKTVLNEIRVARYSVSVGLSFSGTIFALIRTLIAKKKHSFVLRGNRFQTVRQSSRDMASKYFALTRLYFYNQVMVRLLEGERAEVWFQGEETYRAYHNRVSKGARQKLLLLNAVLRRLPEVTKRLGQMKKYDLVFLGRIHKEKGVFDLIQAISILGDEGYTVDAVFIGEGNDKAEAKRFAQGLALADQVRFLGYVGSPQQVAELISAARLFVLPSYTEGLPRAMVESMWLGVPVLVTPVGGVKYVIRDGINGFLVEPRSPRRLADKIKEILILVESNQAEDLIANARRDAVNYSFEHRARHFLEKSTNNPGKQTFHST